MKWALSGVMEGYTGDGQTLQTALLLVIIQGLLRISSLISCKPAVSTVFFFEFFLFPLVIACGVLFGGYIPEMCLAFMLQRLTIPAHQALNSKPAPNWKSI